MNPIKLIPLHIGQAETWANGTENLSVHLTYNLSSHLKFWPDAQPTVAFERADGQKYAHSWSLEGNILHIPLLQADTEIPGVCKCMITLRSGDGQMNTCVFCGRVIPGIDTLGETPSDPALGIIEQVNAAAARAEAAANRAQNGGSGSTGSGSGIFFVHITAQDDGSYTSSASYIEIAAALSAGQMSYAIVDRTFYVPLIGFSEGTAIFAMVANMHDAISTCTVILMPDGSVMVSTQ